MLRRLHHEQPASFAFTPANLAWAQAQIQKYPEGRQASAVIPLLFRAQEQEGWLPKPAIEEIARMLGMAYIRVLEVATFYFMFQLSPVGSVAHIQICGTTPCMLRGSEDLIEFCQSRISREPHHPSADGKFSWEEVECLGACANAPMAQIGKDYYEDLSAESLSRIIDELSAGRVPQPGSQIGRYASEPAGGVTSLSQRVEGRNAHNASVDLALTIGDTVKRIDGTEVPLRAPWLRTPQQDEVPPIPVEEVQAVTPPDGETGEAPTQDDQQHTARPAGVRQPLADGTTVAPEPQGDPLGIKGDHGQAGPTATGADISEARLVPEQMPPTLTAPEGAADDLTRIQGLGSDLATKLNDLGIWHYGQIASWGPGEVAWVNSRLGGDRGAVDRHNWIEQARALANEGGRAWQSAETPAP